MNTRTRLYQPSTKPTGTAQAVPSATPTNTRRVDAQMSPREVLAHEELPRFGGHRVRRRDQAAIDQPARAHGVPGEHDQDPRGQYEKRTPEAGHKAICHSLAGGLSLSYCR